MGTHPIFESDFDCLTESGMSKKTRCLLRIMSFTALSLMAIGFAFPEWYSNNTGETKGLWQNCLKINETDLNVTGLDQEPSSETTITLTTMEGSGSNPDPEPEPEPDCLVKSSFANELWIAVPTTVGLGVSIFGFLLFSIPRSPKVIQTGGDGLIVGSLLYLVGIGSSLHAHDDDFHIGWAMAVGITGMIINLLIGLASRFIKEDKMKRYEEPEELVNPYNETPTVPDHLTAM